MDRMVRRTARGKDGRSWIQAFCRSFEFTPPESTIDFVGPAIYPLARPLSRFSTTVHRKDGGKESGSLLTDLSVVPPPLAFRLAMFEARATLNSTRLPICPAEISATVARPFATSCWIVEAGKESNSFIDLDFVSSPGLSVHRAPRPNIPTHLRSLYPPRFDLPPHVLARNQHDSLTSLHDELLERSREAVEFTQSPEPQCIRRSPRTHLSIEIPPHT
jgi:hypothetical protein